MMRTKHWSGPDNPAPDLGPCCSCGQAEGVRTLVMCAFRSPTPGKGWGCLICDLPGDGAIVALCDDCHEREVPYRFVCTGYPASDGRTPLEGYARVEFRHRRAYHPEMDEGDPG